MFLRVHQEWPVVLPALPEMRCAQKEGSVFRVLFRNRAETEGARRKVFAKQVIGPGRSMDERSRLTVTIRMIIAINKPFESNNTRHASAGSDLKRAPRRVTYLGA